MASIADIAEIEPADEALFGGKASGLARLWSRGLPVPRAVALSTLALRAFLRFNGVDERMPEPAIQRAIRSGRLPPALAKEVHAKTAALGARLVVRSSAVDEDGAERSFAGQYLTVVDVAPGAALEEAIKACWASLYSAPAAIYREGARRKGMGLVVQELIDAQVAGVLFTVDPVSGSWRQMVAEAVWGQGEALVSGRVAPDRYLLQRPRRLPRGLRRVAARLRVEEIEADVVEQPRRMLPGGAWAPTERPNERKLPPQLLKKLGRLGLRAEGMAGTPQDLEWAVVDGAIWLLQARPITAAGPPERGVEPLWTRRFFGERWQGLASPLGWSISAELLRWFVDYPETSRHHLGGAPALRLIRGVPYINVSVFRHLAFKLPGRPPPGFMLDFLPPDEVSAWRRRFAHPPDVAVYRSILASTVRERRWRRFRWNPLTNHRAWTAFQDRLQGELARLDPSAPTLEQAVDVLRRGIELKREYIKIHIISLLLANLGYELLAPALPVDLRDDLLRAPTDNPTVRINTELRRVGRGERSLESFLADYGHRCSHSSWELFTTRWDEDPEGVAVLAQAMQAAPEPRHDEQRDRTEQALSALRRRHPALLPPLRLTRRYLALREEQRFHFDRLMHRLKACARRVGDLLGVGDAIQWLEWIEVQGLASGQRDDADALIALRQAQWAGYATQPPPPVFLQGDRGIELPETGTQLRGLGISPGRVTGTVRIIRSPSEAARLQPGDILVATATDPGWTSLFVNAGGVVLELGSMLSHGAVIAREYQLPAVVNVPGATQVLCDGQLVTVDGGRGVVWLELH